MSDQRHREEHQINNRSSAKEDRNEKHSDR
jgi:hypothetical protein